MESSVKLPHDQLKGKKSRKIPLSSLLPPTPIIQPWKYTILFLIYKTIHTQWIGQGKERNQRNGHVIKQWTNHYNILAVYCALYNLSTSFCIWKDFFESLLTWKVEFHRGVVENDLLSWFTFQMAQMDWLGQAKDRSQKFYPDLTYR